MIDKNLAVTFPQGFLIRQKNMGSASSPNPCWLYDLYSFLTF
ncbi:hypothetical protein U722_01335 [Bacillus amyloliquefaciens LFB112]|nr:hypothetical protein U722_01335 [Bacillus amyloliquefaciens LFB112]